MTTRCPYCAEEILEEAVKCKHCRTSLVAYQNFRAGVAPVVTIQKTSKNIKSAILLGWIGMLWSLLALVAGNSDAFWWLLVSIIWLAFARAAKYWHHA